MEKLIMIQNELKVPKSQYNSFGKYNYRSCEDILEALKPLLAKYNCLVNISDSISLIGSRYYVVANASFIDIETKECKSSTSYAREPENKKGMDESQITGATSSYARKYALNALFLLDDTKDADTMDNSKENKKVKAEAKSYTPAPAPTGESKTKDQVKEAGEWLLEMGGGNKEVAAELLEKYTRYKDMPGLNSLTELKEIKEANNKRFYAIYCSLKREYDKFKSPPPDIEAKQVEEEWWK